MTDPLGTKCENIMHMVNKYHKFNFRSKGHQEDNFWHFLFRPDFLARALIIQMMASSLNRGRHVQGTPQGQEIGCHGE